MSEAEASCRLDGDTVPVRPAIRVVNVTAANLRKLGLTPADVCYVGRAGRFHQWPASKWGNPYRPQLVEQMILPGTDPVKACLRLFRDYAKTQPESWLAELWEACQHGKLPLGCWCHPAPCHADVLAEMLTERFGDVLLELANREE